MLVIAMLAGVAVVIVAAVAMWRSRRRRRLQEWFGSDYDRAVESAGSRHAGEAELLAREKRTVHEPDQL